MILILSTPNDQHANHVAGMLLARGVAFTQFNPARLPGEAELSIACSPTGTCRPVLRVDGGELDLSHVHAVWYRRPDKPVAHGDITDPKVRELIEVECNMVLQDLWGSLDCAWLPAAPLTVHLAERKLLQLKLAGALGFELPPTLTTSSPGDVLEFYRAHEGRVVSKQAAKGFHVALGNSMIRYTELVTPRDLAHAHAIAYCPMTFQAYVPKRVELRITVVGSRVFAAEIHSQTTNHTRHDWRRYDHGRTPHFPHELPPEIERRCIALVQRLGLRYGAIDLILTPDGRYVFLEINPNGQYLWIEDETGLPISDAICDELAGGVAGA